MGRLDFETAYKKYMDSNHYLYNDFDPAREWHYYEKGRSWFAAYLEDLEIKREVERLKLMWTHYY